MSMHIFFSHGKESGPNGIKIQQLSALLRERGLTSESLDYTDTFDPAVRAARLVSRVRAFTDTNPGAGWALAGSSMGGAVSLLALRDLQPALKPAGLFLMAPAVFMPGYETEPLPEISCPVSLIHGWQDEIIPPENAIRFARLFPKHTRLMLLPSGHTLNEVLPDVKHFFLRFLDDVCPGRS
ncbi:MAG: alpha/beta hydrolase [Candidatus Cyclonatronum sp.]|uniref:alpha/beta hydrolase n=1 Tax=Cyclonatronum sp. TaxID=3024185 RepID=UPI0025BE1118|nr:alpha/beta hydrolase [Cyclonatronum sp.]MCC5933322.1 hypothetical protein [Balneolales bacterium]MCH8486714.1 alpha/beta hydrolase [Cyclonatronum sp.]